MKNEKTFQEILSIPVDKTKKLSVWSKIGDNSNGQWDFIVEINHNYTSYLLSVVSKYFDLDTIKVIFDVGSLNGIESVFFTQLLPNVKIYSFEANPDSCLLVKDNQKDYPNITCINKAISDKVENNVVFYLTTENIGASSLLKPTGGYAGTKYNTINVDVTTIEKFSIENNIENIDILWMDIQGNELNALKGMGDLLYNTKAICSEVGLVPYYENHTLYKEICEYLKTFGFVELTESFPFDYPSHRGGNRSGLECDIIFINEKLSKKINEICL